MADAVIVSTARTPIGKAFRGVFNDTHAADMGAHVIKHAAERAKLDTIKSWRDEQAKAEQQARAARDAETAKTQTAKLQEDAEKWVLGEADKFIAARAKSFEGPDSARRTARLRTLALSAAKEAAAKGEDAIGSRIPQPVPASTTTVVVSSHTKCQFQ